MRIPVLAGEPPSIGHVDDTRPHSRRDTSAGAVETQPHEEPLDDWLGDVSDDDWSEGAAQRVGGQRVTPADRGLHVPADDLWREPPDAVAAPAPPVDPTATRRAAVERRRIVAGLAAVVVLGLGAATAVLLLRDGDETPVTSVEATTTTPAPSESTPSTPTTTPTSPSTTPTTTTPSTTPSTPAESTFTLPEGTKLQRGEGDPALVEELQQALSTAGYDPGPADGTFGRRTEAAVAAFQGANGLSVDGRVGPETAAALDTALSTPTDSAFTLPEGTKLRLGEGDPAVVTELQQALSSAGYDPGSDDGTFGPRTKAAVVAFQRANDLSPDGVVGAETAAALNSRLASG